MKSKQLIELQWNQEGNYYSIKTKTDNREEWGEKQHRISIGNNGKTGNLIILDITCDSSHDAGKVESGGNWTDASD